MVKGGLSRRRSRLEERAMLQGRLVKGRGPRSDEDRVLAICDLILERLELLRERELKGPEALRVRRPEEL